MASWHHPVQNIDNNLHPNIVCSAYSCIILSVYLSLLSVLIWIGNTWQANIRTSPLGECWWNIMKETSDLKKNTFRLSLVIFVKFFCMNENKCLLLWLNTIAFIDRLKHKALTSNMHAKVGEDVGFFCLFVCLLMSFLMILAILTGW